MTPWTRAALTPWTAPGRAGEAHSERPNGSVMTCTSMHAAVARTTPPRPVDVEMLFPEVTAYCKDTVRLHPRVGNPGPGDSSPGGPLLQILWCPFDHGYIPQPKLYWRDSSTCGGGTRRAPPAGRR